MTRFFMNSRSMMSHGASADQAEASSCARTANTNIAVILGAILMASIIIISVLVSLLAVLGLLVSLLVLAVLLVTHDASSPLTQRYA